jgi:hypothetical protein
MEECKKKQLHKISKGHKPHNIYNAEETELRFKLLPNEAISLKQNPSSVGRNSKDRIILLLACNVRLKNVQMLPKKYDGTFYYLMDVKDVFYPKLHQHFATT